MKVERLVEWVVVDVEEAHGVADFGGDVEVFEWIFEAYAEVDSEVSFCGERVGVFRFFLDGDTEVWSGEEVE